MNKDEAAREIENLGFSYFYDELGDLAVEEILVIIQEHIQSSHLTGSGQWESWKDAFQTALTECTDEELNRIVWTFGLAPGEADNSRKFFDMNSNVISKAIEKQKRPSL